MEVKTKQGDEMLDATIEMVDGAMVVSPKEVKFEPKDGDVVYLKSLFEYIVIYKNVVSDKLVSYACLAKSNLYVEARVCHKADILIIRPATEKEKKLLFDKLSEEGYSWDAECKELVKLKWKPQDHEEVYVAGFTFYGNNPFCAFEDTAYSGSMQWRAVFERGWYFKTEEECQAFCDRLNDAISQVKP